MRSRRTISFSTLAASVLLLPACDGLLPDRRQSAFDAAAAADSAAGQAERPKSKRRADSHARETTAEPEPGGAFDQIRRSLRVLVAAEQGFYAENGTYSGDLDRLAFRASGESQVKFLWVTRQGWAASGTHPAVPGRDCVVFVGVANAAPTTLRFTRSGREGVVVCDVQPRPRATGGASAPAPPPPVADTSSALDAVNPTVQMRVDLRNLANAQAAYFATQGIYSIRPEQLQLQFSWQRGVDVTLLNADRSSWSARATHASRPGRSCVVWYGSPFTRPATEAQHRVPDRAGVPVCDD
jgi:hypothetical protein